MLQLEKQRPISIDDYYIKHVSDGCDELHFELSLNDPIYALLKEEDRIFERTERQTYVVRSIGGSRKTAKITGQLDLDDWRATIFPDFAREEKTEDELLTEIVPWGWTVYSKVQEHRSEPIKMTGATPLEIAQKVQEIDNCAIRFDTEKKTATVFRPDEIKLSNAYCIETVNLRNPPEYKGKSTALYTRLYAQGKTIDDVPLTFSDINGGVPYVDCHDYTDRVICAFWQDSSIDDAAKLLEGAQRRVKAAASPVRSWQLDVIDLYSIAPEKWPNLSLTLFKKIRLVDENKGFSAAVQIVEDKIYPHYSAKNEITVSTVTGSVQRTLHALYKQINDHNSSLYQSLRR